LARCPGWRLIACGIAAAWGCETAEEVTPAAPAGGRPALAHVRVEPASVQLASLGESIRLTAAPLDINGTTVDGALVTWASSSTAVAVVGSTGLVTARSNGSATIAASVTARGGHAVGSAGIFVAQQAAALTVSPADGSVAPGGTVKLEAAVVDARGNPIAAPNVIWSTTDPSVATVDEGGLVTGLREGRVTIIAGSGGASSRASVTVEPRGRTKP
jgi:uncharacterized protein YjdB